MGGASQHGKPFQATVIVKGEELSNPAPIDESGRLATAKNVPLKPGTNLLSVKLSNQWGSSSLSEEVAVRYLRPPHILTLKAAKPKEGDAVASLEAQARSATRL